jgi:hypothetical protein
LKQTEIRLIVPHKALGIYVLMAVKGVVNLGVHLVASTVSAKIAVSFA